LDHVLGDQHDALVQLLGKKKGVQESIQRDHIQFKNYIHNNRLDKASVIGPTDANRKAVHKMQRDAQKVYNDVSQYHFQSKSLI
jgi:hypothetical protein